MKGAMLSRPRDIRFEARAIPSIEKATDALIRIATIACAGRTFGPYRGVQPTALPTPMGHEYCGFIEEVGDE